ALRACEHVVAHVTAPLVNSSIRLLDAARRTGGSLKSAPLQFVKGRGCWRAVLRNSFCDSIKTSELKDDRSALRTIPVGSALDMVRFVYHFAFEPEATIHLPKQQQ